MLSLLLPLFSGAGDAYAAKVVTTGTLSGLLANALTAAPITGATVKATNTATAAVTSTGSYKLTLPPRDLYGRMLRHCLSGCLQDWLEHIFDRCLRLGSFPDAPHSFIMPCGGSPA